MSVRDRILETAATCFLEQGYNNSRMTAIARLAGISRAGLYKYFSGKDELLLALHARVIQDARQKDLPLLSGDQPPLERLEKWLRSTLRSQWRHHGVRVIALEETQGILAGDDAARAIIEEVAAALAKLIREGVDGGDFRHDLNPRKTAYILQGLVMGVQRNNVSTRPMFTIAKPSEIDLTVSIIVRGLCP